MVISKRRSAAVATIATVCAPGARIDDHAAVRTAGARRRHRLPDRIQQRVARADRNRDDPRPGILIIRAAIGRPITLAAVTVSVLLLESCASPGISTTDLVRVETPGCDGSACELSNDKGRWIVASTPGTASITTSTQPLEIACRAPLAGSPSVPARAPSSVDERGKAGAVSGGVVGAGAGAAVVAPLAALVTPAAPLVLMFVAAGAGAGAGMGSVFDEASRYIHYPETIAVPLVCQSVAPLPSALSAAPVGIVVRGLTDGEAVEAGLAGRGAVIVTRLAAGSRAAQAGLKERDLIVRCNDADVADAAQLQAIIRAAPPHQPLRIGVLRVGKALEISLPEGVAGP